MVVCAMQELFLYDEPLVGLDGDMALLDEKIKGLETQNQTIRERLSGIEGRVMHPAKLDSQGLVF
jgi:hypothetical protein